MFVAALLFAVFLAYQPAYRGGRLWDDDARVARPDLGSWASLAAIWLVPGGVTRQYCPLLHSVFWLEHKLWGDWTLPYHLAQILLHAVAAVLVAMVLRRLTIPGAYLAAAIFALHPLRVESVAWVAEMNTPLSAVFYLGATWMYLGFDEGRNARSYGLALMLFVLALLTKTMTATLPAALLVVFWWRGRLSWRRDVLPLVPFFLLAAAAGSLSRLARAEVDWARGAGIRAYNH